MQNIVQQPFEFVSGLFLFGSKHPNIQLDSAMQHPCLQLKNNFKIMQQRFLSSFLFVALNATRKLAPLNYLQGQMHNVTAYLLFDFQTVAPGDISLLLRCCLVALQANRSIHPSKHPITCRYEVLAITKGGWLQSI